MPIYGFSVNKLYDALNILASFKYQFLESKPVRLKLISQDHISHHGAYCQKTERTNCGYTWEPSRRGVSKEYQQSVLEKKKYVNPCIPKFCYKSGVYGANI